MTSRERIEAALSHRQPDRTPVFEYLLLPPLADIFLGRPAVGVYSRWNEAVAELGWEGAVRRSVLDELDLAVILGHDMLFIRLPPGPPSAAPGEEPPPDGPVERLRLRNERAAAMPQAMPESRFLVYDLLGKEMEERGLDLPVMASAAGHGVWTDTDLMETMLLAPEIARRHFELATARCLRLLEHYARFPCVSMVQVGGDFAGTRPLISPAAYREFIVPEVRRVSRRVRAAGRVAVNASDGNLWPVLEDFLFGCEAEGYCEVDWHAGMRMEKLKPVCRGRVVLFGNLDCGNVLSFAPPGQVRGHVRECLDAGMGDGGHVLCASNAVTGSVPMVNYLAAVNAYREYFGLPLFAR